VGYLDQLKKQLDNVQQQDNQRASELAEQSIVQKLQPGLRAILHYLEELVGVLNEIKPQLMVSYEIEGYGELIDLRQQRYQVQVDNREDIRQITLSFECLDERLADRIFTVDGRDAYLRQREYLWKNNLRFKEKFVMGGQGKFFLEPKVRVQFIFIPDTRQQKIRLELRNYHALGRTLRWIAPDNIGDTSLDHDLGGLILRKINDLNELSTGQMTEKMRQEIKEKLRQAQEAKEHLEERIAAEEEKEQIEAGLVNRLRRNLNALVRKR
jgi:hypothetical protein